jgi:hypothetical protein
VSIIQLTQDKSTLVDDEDYNFLSQWRWLTVGGKYAGRYEYHIRDGVKKKVCIYLHRFLLQTPPDMDTDHKNGDCLDNRRSNLRICTTAQNLANRTKLNSRNTSGYKGVSFDKKSGRWVAQIGWQRGNKRRNFVLGYYDTPLEAAVRYEKESIARYGEFARLEVSN